MKRAVAGRLRGGPESELVFNALSKNKDMKNKIKQKKNKNKQINSKHVVIPNG